MTTRGPQAKSERDAWGAIGSSPQRSSRGSDSKCVFPSDAHKRPTSRARLLSRKRLRPRFRPPTRERANCRHYRWLLDCAEKTEETYFPTTPHGSGRAWERQQRHCKTGQLRENPRGCFNAPKTKPSCRTPMRYPAPYLIRGLSPLTPPAFSQPVVPGQPGTHGGADGQPGYPTNLPPLTHVRHSPKPSSPTPIGDPGGRGYPHQPATQPHA